MAIGLLCKTTERGERGEKRRREKTGTVLVLFVFASRYSIQTSDTSTLRRLKQEYGEFKAQKHPETLEAGGGEEKTQLLFAGSLISAFLCPAGLQLEQTMELHLLSSLTVGVRPGSLLSLPHCRCCSHGARAQHSSWFSN